MKPPAGMTIIVDTRERDPFEFLCPTKRIGLPSGDYSIEGFERIITVERKRPAELFTNFGKHRDRFQREFERLRSYSYACVVIEGTLPECSTIPNPDSIVSPAVLFGSLVAWAQRYGVHPFFAHDRRHAQALTYKVLEIFFKHHRESASSYAHIHKVEFGCGQPARQRTWREAYMQEHTEFVGQALELFKHSTVNGGVAIDDKTVDWYFEQFRQIAQQRYPDQDAWARFDLAFAGLNEIIVRLDFGAALARGVRARMEVVKAEAEGDAA